MDLPVSDESLAHALENAVLRLTRGEPTSETKALLLEARRLKRIIANWRSLPAYVEARDAMLKHVERLTEQARSIFPSIPPPAIEESAAAPASRPNASDLVSAFSAAAIDWVPSSTLADVELKMLSTDPSLRSFTAMVRLKPGGTIPSKRRQVSIDFYVLSGSMAVGSERVTPGYYCRVEPSDESQPVTSAEGCEFLALGVYRGPAE